MTIEELYRQIPLTAAMQLQLQPCPRGWRLSAPLAPNSNDKGTAFAGSLSALLQVAGWVLWQDWCDRTLPTHCQVLAVNFDIQYRRPIVDTLEVTVLLPDNVELQRIEEALRRHQKARTQQHMVMGEEADHPAITARIDYALRCGLKLG